jgi:hypothetical protein
MKALRNMDKVNTWKNENNEYRIYKDSKREAQLNDKHTIIPNFLFDMLVPCDNTGGSMCCLTFIPFRPS